MLLFLSLRLSRWCLRGTTCKKNSFIYFFACRLNRVNLYYVLESAQDLDAFLLRTVNTTAVSEGTSWAKSIKRW
jgi:hypothetical protein